MEDVAFEMEDVAFEEKLREALAAESCPNIDAAIMHVIEMKAVDIAAEADLKRRLRSLAWLEWLTKGLLAASLAAAAFLYIQIDSPAQIPQVARPQTFTNAPAAAAATDTAAAALAATAAAEQDASQFSMDEADIMLELTSMSQDCLIL